MLYNSKGDVFDFQRSDALLISPSGLGFSMTEEVARSGDFYLQTNEYPAQATIDAQIAFKTYEAYTEYAMFIRYTPLRLAYAPLDDWYYRDITQASLGKGEFENEGTRLYAPVQFRCYAGWYTEIVKEATAETPITVENPKKYPYSYSYGYNGTASGQASIVASGKDIPLRIIIYGACVNPSFTVYNGGKRIARGKFNIRVAEGEKLVVDSNPLTMTAAIYSVDTDELLRSAYGASDLSTERFVYLPIGENRIAVTADGDIEGLRATVEVKDYADAV